MDTLTYSGKTIKKMNYNELKRERELQLWFAARMVRLATICGYALYRKKEECAELYNLEESEEQYKRGEIDKKEYYRRRKNYRTRQTYIHKTEEQIAFCQKLEIHARAMVSTIDEELASKPKPLNRVKPYTPYKIMPERMRKRNRKRNAKRGQKVKEEREALIRWQKKIETKGLGSLWDREKFKLICSDRGYVTTEAVNVLVADALNIHIRQAPGLLKSGAFTWGQVLTLGSALYMNPKEFCDTFLAGYFVELTDGVFEASAENLPDFSDNSDK